jgi:hypothetical protein
MTHRFENLQPSLFETERPCVELHAARKNELATIIEVLLREISRSTAALGGLEAREQLARSGELQHAAGVVMIWAP